MANYYSDEKNVQILLALLKKHNIKKVIASPGTTNMALVASMQFDSFFEVYSSVDERSAAYLACGLATESGEPVIISCTGATASRNYLPGLTEAFYRKLPILSITSTQPISKVGHHIAQVIDREILPKDCVKSSFLLPNVNNSDDEWECEIKVNTAILDLYKNGGGPVHINLTTSYKAFKTEKLPKVKKINRYLPYDKFPEFPEGKVCVFLGAHKPMSDTLIKNIETFCENNNGIVICDHTSNYKGKYKVNYSMVLGQRTRPLGISKPEVLIHIGEVSGDYFSITLDFNQVWRVSEDGIIRDTFRKLTNVFETTEEYFFNYYTHNHNNSKNNDKYYNECLHHIESIKLKIPELPFSNIWMASQISSLLPNNSTIHFAILNSLRAWNFFELPESVSSMSNVGGFGIDGCVSTLIGASFLNKDKLFYGVVGDLAFFYDMNVLGNRHVGNNIRLLLVNNGSGVEFRQYRHHAYNNLGKDAEKYVAAAGHYGNKSNKLVKTYAESLGFEYLTASNKVEFINESKRFLDDTVTDRPMLFEVFTNNEEESEALETITNLEVNAKGNAVKFATQILGNKRVNALKKVIKK